MQIRDAVEADAAALASLADAPRDVMRNLVHDRTVRVAVRETDAGPHADAGEESDEADSVDGDEPGRSEVSDDDHLGFVSFDASGRTVHVTQLAGTLAACERLLSEPVRFAANEGMDVELIVRVDDESAREAAETVGFDAAGPGPRFDGRKTVRYRYTP